jgi:hypothetical protein
MVLKENIDRGTLKLDLLNGQVLFLTFLPMSSYNGVIFSSSSPMINMVFWLRPGTLLFGRTALDGRDFL